MVYEKFLGFLTKHPKTGNGEHTHTIYGGKYGGSYTIPNEKIEELYKLYHKSVFVKKDQFSIVEKVQPICRLVVDLDFKYKNKLETRQYNPKVLQSIIQMVFDSIDEHYICSEDQKVCFVMEKKTFLDAPQKNYQSKDGVHLLFPYIVAEKETYLILRKTIIQNDITEFFEKESMIPPSNSIEEIFDEKIYISGNWFLYGSGKPNEINYKLSSIYKQNGDTLSTLSTELYLENPHEIIHLNSVSLQDSINVEYNEDTIEQLGEKQFKKKSLLNSISSDSLESLEEYNNPEMIMTKAQKYDSNVTKKLIDCLSIERASDCKTWIDVGYCLHSISPSTMLPYWIAFSKKWSMYANDDECKKQWEYMNKTNHPQYTISSLHYWARKDNYEKWQTIIKESLEDLVKISIKGDKSTGPHADVANVIYHYFKDIFVCGNIKENSWYYFNEKLGGKWESTEQGHILRSRLSSDIVDLYMFYQKKYQDELKTEEEDSDQSINLNNKITNICKVIVKLKDSSYKDKIMKECREYFYDKAFMEKLNDKKNLFGFENGIYDLDKSVFREGLPDDYISISCGLIMPVIKSTMPIKINDILDEVEEIPQYKELQRGLDDFLRKVFPLEEVREYTLRFLASCLSGDIREEKFYFWTGCGGNGKSKLVELMDYAFGDYSRTMDVAYLTTKRGSSSAASPELESIKHARFVCMSEPEKTDQIYVGKLKQMTGGDKMTTRGLFKETTQFKPQFKMVLMCNDLPKLAGNDGGIWRRIEVVKYIAKFTDNPKPCPAAPHQYLADEQLSSKLKEWNLLFMIKLLSKYRDYDKEGTNPPPAVKDETKSYRTSNDIIANWCADDLVESDEFCSFTELWDAFQRWSSDEGYNQKQIPEKNEIKEALFKLQEKTEYGLVLGKNKSENCPNGTKRAPRFNLKSIDE
jgi:P4 family phage/plasmid primase-like protien